MPPSPRRARRAGTAAVLAYVPQLPSLVARAPEGGEWLHEIKHDGYRIGCRIEDGRISLWSRNGNDWSAHFPEILDAVSRLGRSHALLDGEIAILLPDGRSSFQALQQALRGGGRTRARLVYFLFDLLELEGESLAATPLEQRKARLAALLESSARDPRLRYSEHVVGNGPKVLAEACRLGLEGIVSKRRDGLPRPGRSKEWLKVKCFREEPFVIGGFTDPEGSRQGIGGLFIGQYDAAGRLHWAGKVGTGFTHKVADDLRRRLEAAAAPASPFHDGPRGALARLAHWAQPALVASVAFAEWTDDGKVRHPSFRGLRTDVRPEDVRQSAASSGGQSTLPSAPLPAPATAPVRPPKEGSRSARRGATEEVAGVRLTHPDRVLFPDIGVTKLALAHVYERIAEWALPHLAGRPLTLVRCPEGVSSDCHYLKHSEQWSPEPLRRVKIREKKKVGEYLVADTLPALVGLVQMNVLEIHTWNATIDDLEHPDRLVFDVDPGADVPWRQVIETARLLNSVLAALGLDSFVKTTGGRGLHVVVPIVPHADWALCLEFARTLAGVLVERDPSRYTMAFKKAGRERKLLIDYMRNNRGSTSVAAFSTRARPHAPLSVPIGWSEVARLESSDRFTVQNLERRLAALRGDPWEGYRDAKQRLEPGMLEALRSL